MFGECGRVGSVVLRSVIDPVKDGEVLFAGDILDMGSRLGAGVSASEQSGSGSPNTASSSSNCRGRPCEDTVRGVDVLGVKRADAPIVRPYAAGSLAKALCAMQRSNRVQVLQGHRAGYFVKSSRRPVQSRWGDNLYIGSSS